MNVVPRGSKRAVARDCSDLLFRLSAYEAGHALVAWALGHSIVAVRMLPRPAVTETEKAFVSNSWRSFYDVLEARAMELFGGQIAEELVCGGGTFFTGDVSRIDEITRILAGLTDDQAAEDIFFRLEDQTYQIFADKAYVDAIRPVAALLYERETTGQLEIPGADIEEVIARYVPRPANTEKPAQRLLKFLMGRA